MICKRCRDRVGKSLHAVTHFSAAVMVYIMDQTRVNFCFINLYSGAHYESVSPEHSWLASDCVFYTTYILYNVHQQAQSIKLKTNVSKIYISHNQS